VPTYIDEILDDYGLTRETTAKYIDAIVQFNQTDTADAIDISRRQVSRYKDAFQQMTAQERLIVVAALAQDQALATTLDDR
jgi:hypothetical protein